MSEAVRVGIVVGSESDLPVMNTCGEVLDGYGIGWEIGVMSAHRAGDRSGLLDVAVAVLVEGVAYKATLRGQARDQADHRG